MTRRYRRRNYRQGYAVPTALRPTSIPVRIPVSGGVPGAIKYAKDWVRRNPEKARYYGNKAKNWLIWALGVGISGLVKTLKDRLEAPTGGSDTYKPIPIMNGTSSATGTGDITETHFSSTREPSVSSSVKTVLKNSTTLALKTQTNGRLYTSNSKQAATTLAVSTTAAGTIDPPTSFATSCFILGGSCRAGYTTISANKDWGSLYSLLRSNTTVAGSSEEITYYNTSGYLYLDRTKAELVLSNTGNSSCVVDIYELLAKEDYRTTYVDGVDENATALNRVTALQSADPIKMWEASLANYSLGDEVSSFYTPSKFTSTTIGVTPRSSQVFNAQWEICAKHRVTLAVGAAHVHKSDYIYQMLVPTCRIVNNQLLARTTRTYMMILRGVAGTTGSNNQADMSCNISWTCNTVNYGAVIQPQLRVITETFSDSRD